MEVLYDYRSCEYVDFNQWVKIKNLGSGEESMCMVSQEFTPAVYKNILVSQKSNPEKLGLSGIIWLHTPLGGAIIGRRINDEFGFYVNGQLIRCKVLKILS